MLCSHAGAAILLNVADAKAMAAVGLPRWNLDGITDDRASIQASLNYLATHGGGEITIPAGKVAAILPHNPCIIIPSNVPITIEGGYNSGFKVLLYPPGVVCHIFTTGGPYRWEHPTDNSPGLTFRNLTFDGNGPNQSGWGSYSKEQYFLFYLSAYPGPGPTGAPGGERNNAGRLNVSIEGCFIKDTLSDGISVGQNVNLKVYKTNFKDNLRGGVVALGGYSNIDYQGGTCYVTRPGFMSFQYEFAYEFGYHNSRQVNITARDIVMEGAIDLAGTDAGTWNLSRITQRGPYATWGIMPVNTKLRISDSYLIHDGTWGWVTTANDAQMDRVTFSLRKRADGTWRPGGYAMSVAHPAKDGVVTLNDCIMKTEPGYQTTLRSAGLSLNWSWINGPQEPNATVNVNNLTVNGPFQYNVALIFPYGITNINGGKWGPTYPNDPAANIKVYPYIFDYKLNVINQAK
jgi:hypothetical protein